MTVLPPPIRRMMRRAFASIAAVSLLLFIGIGIGWLAAHINRDLNSSPVLMGEFVHPWNNHGGTMYMTSNQKYWVLLFDRLSEWSFLIWALALTGWFGFMKYGAERGKAD